MSDPVCRERILGSGPSGRQSLADALLDAYGSGSNGTEPPLDVPAPEPGTAALLSLGLGAIGFASRSGSGNVAVARSD